MELIKNIELRGYYLLPYYCYLLDCLFFKRSGEQERN